MLNIHCINTHYENFLFFIYDVSWNCVYRIYWHTNCIWKKLHVADEQIMIISDITTTQDTL